MTDIHLHTMINYPLSIQYTYTGEEDIEPIASSSESSQQSHANRDRDRATLNNTKSAIIIRRIATPRRVIIIN